MDEQTLVSGLDIMPTLCDYARVAIPAGKRINDTIKGVSLRATLEGDETPSRAFIAAEVASNLGQMIRTSRYKYIAHKDDGSEMLFDMQMDPGETTNLALDVSHSADLDRHRAMLRKWIDGLDVAPGVPTEHRWFS